MNYKIWTLGIESYIHDYCIDHQRVELYPIGSLEHIQDSVLQKKEPFILLTPSLKIEQEVLKILASRVCDEWIIVPKRCDMQALISTLVYSEELVIQTRHREKRMLIGYAASIDEIMSEILMHFHYLEHGKTYTFILQSTHPQVLPELARIEDLLKEYIEYEATIELKTLPPSDKLMTDFVYILTSVC